MYQYVAEIFEEDTVFYCDGDGVDDDFAGCNNDGWDHKADKNSWSWVVTWLEGLNECTERASYKGN